MTPEELEVAIANRDKALLVDFYGAHIRRAPGLNGQRSGTPPSPPLCRALHAPSPHPPAATWCGPCLLLAQELEKVGTR